ncbi:GNAT family N-acetyltransferase [Sporosarcina sp. G11-34]|uniref:GNAT family N-acetyltransferase n=1 Tax=Sporosarcina sp. G11-34 TaxID=2849605 RepID=UPI0022A95C2C|nr:GNAT family N-acetyltransferase [Sporosarcina sp. G11-34]
MIEIRELTIKDGTDVFEMIQDIGVGENGFANSLHSDSFPLFQEKLLRNYEMSEALNLEPQYVPQTIYWLYANGKPVGYGKLRHYLSQNLLQHGGHIGYVISPINRGKGYAKKLLKELLQKAKEKGIDRVLLTCDVSNMASRKVIESNNGQLKEMKNDSCFYWINII